MQREGSDYKWAPAYIAAGYLTLLGSAFFDSMRGPLVPVLVDTLKLPFATVSWFLTIGNITAVVILSVLNRALRLFGEKWVGVGVCLLATTAGILAPLVSGYQALLLLGVIVGGSVAIIGALCNIYTLRGSPPPWRSRMLVGNHVMYGIGSFAAPLMLSAAEHRGIAWSWVVIAGSCFFFMTGLFIAFKMPRLPSPVIHEHREAQNHKDFQILVMALFAIYVVGEVTAGTWLVSYLNKSLDFTISEASRILAAMYMVMALTRLACFGFISQRWEKPVLWASVLLPLAAYAAGRSGSIWAFALMGLFGPFFPVLLARVSRVLPDIWPALTVKVIFAIQIAQACFHALVGYLISRSGIAVAYLVPPASFLVVLVLLGVYFRREALVAHSR